MSRSVKVLQGVGAKKDSLIDQLSDVVTVPRNGIRPWESGWSQARDARDVVGLSADEPFGVEKIVGFAEEHSEDRGLVGLGGLTDGGGHALVAARHMSDSARRFASARALWRFAATPGERFLLTAAHSDRQKIERAFAAELLAPAAGVESFVSDVDGFVGYEVLELAAEHFGVSPWVIQHQVENQLELAVTD